MRIGNSTGNMNFMGNQANKAGGRDSYAQSIQKQIGGIQEQLKSLSENKQMSAEEKTAKRKELQEQMAELNKQLMERQHAKMQESKKKSHSNPAADKNAPKQKAKSGGMGKAAMQSIISADNSMKQVAVSNGAKTQLEGKANVLKVEIEIDKSRNGNTERKEAELAAAEEQINTVSNDIMSNIAKITEELNNARTEGEKEEAAKTDKSKEKDGQVDTDKNDIKVNANHGMTDANAIVDNIDNIDDKDSLADGNSDAEQQALSASESQAMAPDLSAGREGASANPKLTAGTMETYVPVDIKL